jgi:hypothetical protein
MFASPVSLTEKMLFGCEYHRAAIFSAKFYRFPEISIDRTLQNHQTASVFFVSVYYFHGFVTNSGVAIKFAANGIEANVTLINWVSWLQKIMNNFPVVTNKSFMGFFELICLES